MMVEHIWNGWDYVQLDYGWRQGSEARDGKVFYTTWRSHEIWIWRDAESGRWDGDMIAYGEHGRLLPDEALRIAIDLNLARHYVEVAA